MVMSVMETGAICDVRKKMSSTVLVSRTSGFGFRHNVAFRAFTAMVINITFGVFCSMTRKVAVKGLISQRNGGFLTLKV